MLYSLISPVYAVGQYGTADWEAAECASQGVATIKGIECLIGNILLPLPGIIALAAVAMIILAGIKIINAGSSDSKALAAGWATFTYAIVGLILLSVVWLALVIIENYTGTTVTQFGIGP